MALKSSGDGYHNLLNNGDGLYSFNINHYNKHESSRARNRSSINGSLPVFNRNTNRYGSVGSSSLLSSMADSSYSEPKAKSCYNLTIGFVGSKRIGSPVFGDEYSLFQSRSNSGSSSSVNSIGTVCESEIVPFGEGIHPKPGNNAMSSSSKAASDISHDRNEPSNNSKNTNDALEKDLNSNLDIISGANYSCLSNTSEQSQRNSGIFFLKSNNVEHEDDTNSVSTVSGTGIDFFRKFVQRKGSNCKDCEDQFRREVLINRLVMDSLNTKATPGDNGSSIVTSRKLSNVSASSPISEMSDNYSATSLNESVVVSSIGAQDMEQKAKGSASRCKTHQHPLQPIAKEDTQSIASKASGCSSSISGSGLLFLRNYLKKKKTMNRSDTADSNKSRVDPKDISAFNIVPVPFPPPSNFYGPAFLQDGGHDYSSEDSSERRLSLCSTVADLLNEDFDCDDSELKNLDWDEWDESLPKDICYDDLVSVISESFYSDDLDLGDLCDLDLEGRKTVVANDTQVLSSEELIKNEFDILSSSDENDFHINHNDSHDEQQDNFIESIKTEKGASSKGRKYENFKSSTFMQDLEAELELPPLTPVSDEKDEAVRAISRTISKYIRTGSNSSYTTEIGRQSRQSTCDQARNNRNSRTSMNSPATSDNLPELASKSPTPVRRPLSQLLFSDVPVSSSPKMTSSASPDIYKSEELSHQHSSGATAQKLQVRETKNTIHSPSKGEKEVKNHRKSNDFTHQRIMKSKSADRKSPVVFFQNKRDCEYEGSKPNIYETKISGCGSTISKNMLRDIIPVNNSTNNPPSCATQCAPTTRIPYLQHSSSNNSADSGCPLIDTDKISSLSPTPSPRTDIEVLSSNRNKLTSFWEKSVTSSASEVPLAWAHIKGSNLSDNSLKPQGFQPFQSKFGSESSLPTSNDRLAHFHDVTRRAAKVKAQGRRNPHRASTGSDCSDFLEMVSLSPQTRRRDSFIDYFSDINSDQGNI